MSRSVDRGMAPSFLHPTSIHRSAWNRNSANFAFHDFYEVELPLDGVLRSFACLANDYAIAGVGRLYLCVDVAPVEARPAAGTVAGVAVVYVEEVIAREPMYLVLVVGVGIRVDTVEVPPCAYEIPRAVTDSLVDGLPSDVAVTRY